MYDDLGVKTAKEKEALVVSLLKSGTRSELYLFKWMLQNELGFRSNINTKSIAASIVLYSDLETFKWFKDKCQIDLKEPVYYMPEGVFKWTRRSGYYTLEELSEYSYDKALKRHIIVATGNQLTKTQEVFKMLFGPFYNPKKNE